MTLTLPNDLSMVGRHMSDDVLKLISQFDDLQPYLTPVERLRIEDMIYEEHLDQARHTIIGMGKYLAPLAPIDDLVHALIAETLEAVVRGEIKRLQIFAPPRLGKTFLTSTLLPIFWLAHRPNDQVILVGHMAEFIEETSGDARMFIESDEFQDLFPGFTTRQDSRAKNRWRLFHPDIRVRGAVRSFGILGGIVGRGGHLIIIDDPIRGPEQADSLSHREKVWKTYQGAIRTRLEVDGALIVVNTRWHEDDLSGRLMVASQTPAEEVLEEIDEWTVLRLPAIAETQEARDRNNVRMGLSMGLQDPLGRQPGESIAPRKWSLSYLLSAKREVGPFAWSAQYQGAPTLPEGNWFKRAYFQTIDAIPLDVLDRQNLRWVRYWDQAATPDGGAFTVGLLMARADDGRIYICDVVRGQWDTFERYTQMKATALRDHIRYDGKVTIYFEKEPGSAGKDAEKAILRELAGYPVYGDDISGSKDTRLVPFHAQAAGMNVWMLKGVWNMAYVEEMVSLPNSTYRDQGDATSGAFNQLVETGVNLGIASAPMDDWD